MEQEFMQKAIQLANKNVRKKGRPFGAIVVRDGEIISTGVNEVNASNDPTAHAEIQAIREACQRLKTIDLIGAEMYASGEPCPMCLAAIYRTRFKKVYYAFPTQSKENELGATYIYKELCLPKDKRAIPMIKLDNQIP